ncbi:hypothetical protein [Mucilaginibacter paludis]|uniref:Uncharacterized protein n=1 Tax=Mucilaginibacter paludis DSM 18603 TaxID=714943 RepID=H1YDQ1_9SPHI|nr:hypothetical protein [Mucilaginibacter paludis]EHQ30740.1 hypothetical protein Mucpa_6690 [Mucilaginibacter paludis DSM 18603]
MNQTFSLKRFTSLFKKHTIENYRGYLMQLFVLLGILIVTVAILSNNTYKLLSIQVQTNVFVFFFIAAGTIFTSNIFINLGDKRRSITTLTLPASAAEKFLVGWLYSYVIFQVLFIVVYYTVVILFLKLHNAPTSPKYLMNVFEPDQILLLMYMFYIFFHSIMIYGALFFKKMHFIKTVFCFFIIAMVIWFLNAQVLHLIFHHAVGGPPPFTGVNYWDNNSTNNVTIDLTDDHSPQLIYALFYIMSVMIWFAAYFRLKEKQV